MVCFQFVGACQAVLNSQNIPEFFSVTFSLPAHLVPGLYILALHFPIESVSMLLLFCDASPEFTLATL
jgi:hypothetical protein